MLIAIVIIGGLTEGIGITLFIPLLAQISPTSSGEDAISVYFYKVLNLIHIHPTFNSILLLIVSVFLMKALITLMQEAVSSHITADLTKDLRNQMISAYADMKYLYYLDKNIGYLNNIITTEIERAVAAFGDYCNTIVAIIYLAVYTGASFLIGWQVSALALISGAMLVFTFRFLNHLSRHYSLLTSEKNASLQGILIQTIQFFKYLKATNSLKRIRPKLDEEIKTLADYVFKLGLIGGTLRSLKEPVAVILLAGLLFFQVSLMGKAFAGVMVIILLFYRLISRVFMFQISWQKFNGNRGGIDTYVRTFEEIDENREIKGTKVVNRFNNNVRLTDINFSFGDKQILFDINMEITKKQIVAIVGESGSGKSTLADLITGILRPTSGDLYFDDVNYNNLDLESMRLLIGYVTQEPIIFHDSIANNISLWRCDGKDASGQSKIDRAAMAAYCDEFVKHKESGYQTIIGDRGIKLSGGQRQRLSIARELFKEPEILILDEATSSLDSQSESFIQKSIDGLKGNKTIIIIAHRMSTIKNCDYVYVMYKGRIVEEGSYSDLYNRDTRFSRMCQSQQL